MTVQTEPTPLQVAVRTGMAYEKECIRLRAENERLRAENERLRAALQEQAAIIEGGAQ